MGSEDGEDEQEDGIDDEPVGGLCAEAEAGEIDRKMRLMVQQVHVDTGTCRDRLFVGQAHTLYLSLWPDGASPRREL